VKRVTESISHCERSARIHGPAGSPGRLRAGAAGLAILILALPACRTTSGPAVGLPTREARAEDLLLSGDPNAAIIAFRDLADTAGTPAEKARAQIGIARCYLKLSNWRKALDALYTARSLSEIGPLRETIDRLFGEASFRNGDYGIARNYLEKSLSWTTGAERNLVLAKLHVCAKRTSDARAAERYLGEIPAPFSAEIREILRGGADERAPVRPPSPPAVAARPPRATGTPEPEPREPESTGVIPRGSWGASPVILGRIDPMGRIYRLTIHHTGGPTFWGRSSAETAYEIRKIQRVHQRENHWADIGYHYIIDRVGRVWQGRPLAYQGAHAHGTANRGNIGIVVLGNYVHQGMTTAQIRTLRSLVHRLSRQYSIPSSRIYTHGEIRHGQTDCPGPAVASAVEGIRRGMAVGRLAD
jgi:tetratricopeptide (TPR) repeat protein